MFNIGLVSRWHNHGKENRYTDQLKNIPEAKITCVWDEDKKRGAEWAKEFSVDFEESLEAMLARGDVDGIVITSSSDMHKDIILKAAKAKKHVFTEKPLTLNYADSLEVCEAAEKAGIEVGVVFPRRSNREYLYAKKLCESGAFGDICLLRARVAVTNLADIKDEWFSPEPVGAGGAVRDLGCHLIDTACWMLGEPETISVTNGYVRNFEVEDTGICNLTFKNGAIAVLDSTYSAPLCNNWYNLEIYGSKLAYIADTENVTMIFADGTKKVMKISEIEEGYPLPIKQWINACTKQGENLCTAKAGALVDKVLEAAATAAKEKRTVNI